MKLVLAVAALVAFAAVCQADDDPTVSLSGIKDLTPDDFDAFVNGRKHALVEFYAPWCGHCKRMTPEFKKLGEKIATDGKLSSRVVVAKVDADKHRSLGERFGVRGFPTVTYFARGKAVEDNTAYQGARTYEGFLKFIEDQLQQDKAFARTDSLDALATKFLAAAEDARAAVVDEAKAAAAAVTGEGKDAAELYGRYMGKAIAKGSDFFRKEYDRLERIIENGSVSASKLGEVAKKASVLSAFIPELNEDASATATKEDGVEVEAEEVEEE